MDDRYQKRRIVKRHSLRNKPNADILYACDGIAVKLSRRFLWWHKMIGPANVKDVSRGGLSFISPYQLKPESVIWIHLGPFELPVLLTHRQHILETRLYTYGCRFHQLTPAELAPVYAWLIENYFPELA